MFFVRLDEWGWDEAPPRVPMFPGDLPRQDHPLPKALDDAAAAKLLRAAQADKRLLVRVTVEMLLRTGLRVSEYTSLRADAVVHIGAGPWLHVPVGKLREDRYLPLHPHLVALIDDYRTRHVAAGNPLLLPRENGKPADRHAVTRYINKAGAAAGLPHIHPHQLRHTLATQAINRGMSLEAIAAMLGHRSLDMTLRYAKIASRTVADEYFAVTDKVEALYGQAPVLPADAIGPEDGPAAPRAPPDARQRLLHPARRAGLRVRVDLRNLHVLPDQHRVPPHPPSPARRRHHQAPRPPRAAVRLAARPHRPGRLMNQPATAPRPPRPAARTRHRRRQPPGPHRSDRQPRPAAHALLARRLRRPPARPGQPHRPGPATPAPGRPRRPRPGTHLDPDRRTPQHHRRHRGAPLPEQAMINLTRITGIMPMGFPS